MPLLTLLGGEPSPLPPGEELGGESTAQPLEASPDPRSIDPSECWIKHVRRGEPGDPSAIEVARAYFVRDDTVTGEDGLQGRQGWQAAETTAVLSDDGSFTVVLPNAAGDDGVLHRRRFRILTDTAYEPGEEWLEFWRDPNDLVYVGTPTDYEKSKSTITIKGTDLPVVLAGAISSEVDVWDGTAPADVLGHYTRIPVLAYGADLTVMQTGAVGKWGAASYTQELSGISTDCWTCEARLRWVSAQPTAASASFVRLDVAGLSLQVDVFDGSTILIGVPERNVTAKRQGLVVPGPVDLRFVARYDRIFAFVAGELTAEFRRSNEWPDMSSAEINAYGGTVANRRARRDAATTHDRHLVAPTRRDRSTHGRVPSTSTHTSCSIEAVARSDLRSTPHISGQPSACNGHAWWCYERWCASALSA